MKTHTHLSKIPLRTTRTRRVLLTGIASLLTAHAGFATEATFSSGAFTGDADSGVSNLKIYTAIGNIIGGDVAVNGVNGATFIGSGGAVSGTGWALGPEVTNQYPSGAGGNHTTTFGGSVIDDLFDGFQYNGNPFGTMTMSGLTAGQTYVTTFYNEAWGLGANRTQTVSSTEGASIVYNEDALEASVLKYTFVATGSTTVLNFAPQIANNTMHFYGVSNEQVFTGNTWSPASGNSWDTAANWSTSVQNAIGSNATFSSQAGPTSVTVDSPTTVGHIEILGTGNYTFSGANTLTLQTDAGGSSVLQANAGAHTISAPLQLNSAVAKFGAGSVRLTGAVAGLGKGLTIGNGAVVFETATADLTSVGNIVNDGALSFVNAGAQSYGGVISGTGSLTKSGNGTLTLGASSTYGGATVISGGTLKLSPRIDFANGGFETHDALGGGSYGYQPTGATWTFGTNSGIGLNGGPFFNPTNHEGVAGGFIQGDLGGISQMINVGEAGPYTLNFQGVSRAGAGPNGILIQVDGSTVRTIDPAEFSETAWQNFSTPLNLTVGSHTIAFVGNNVLGGDRSSVVDAVSTGGGLLPSGTALSLTTAGAALNLSGNIQTVGSLAGVAGTNVQNIGALTAGGDNSSTVFAGVLSGAGSFTKAGNGTLTLSAAQTYGGSTTISGGMIDLVGGSLPMNTALALTSGTSSLSMGGASHTFGSLAGAPGSVVLGGGASITAGNNNASTTFAGTLSGVANLTKEGTGKLTLSGTLAYTGNTTVSAGILQTEAAITGGAMSVAGGATWYLAGANHTVTGLTGAGNITRNAIITTGADGASLISTGKNYVQKLDFGGGGSGGATVNGVTFSDTVSTSGSDYTLTGAGNQYTEGNQTGLHSGYDQLVDDFYYNGNPGTLTFGNLTIGQTYEAVLYTKVGHWGGRPQDATFDEDGAGPISNQLLNTNPDSVGYYAYDFVAQTSSMSISMLPVNQAPLASFHWFAASLESVSSSPVSLTPKTLTIGDSGNYSFSGVISGPTGLIKQGSGIQELSGASTYSGGTNINGGAIISHHAAGLGTGPVSIASGANYLAWWNTGSPIIANNFTLNGPGGNPGGGLKDAIYADGGAGGFAEYTISGNVTLAATSNIGGNNSNNLRITGQITGAGGLTKGSGRADENNTLFLANTANDYAGDTVINKGTLKLAASEVIPNGAGKGGVTIGTGATLDLGGFRETINRLSGTGTITTTASIGAAVYFSNDSGTGISMTKTYSHALDFAEGSSVVINGVTFTGAGLTGANWNLNLGGAPGTAGNGNTGATGDISTLLTNFFYNGNPAVLTLSNLTPGVNYETRLYQRQWGGDRTQLFTLTSGTSSVSMTFDEDASATPSYLPFRYTADATGTATITTNAAIPGNTYHWYGLTNEVLGTPKLTVGDATNSTFSGAINGPLEIEKVGAGSLTLDGALDFPTLTANQGVTNLNSTLGTGSSTINANATMFIHASQTLAALNIADGVVVTFGDGLALAGAPEKFGSSAAVPEPGSMTLLLGGLAALLGLRRRKE